MTTTQTFDKKGVYHSALVRAGKLVVRFKGEPRQSKFEGKPDYIYFEVQGDDTEYSYNIENPAIGDLLTRAPKDVWVECLAEGSRDGAVLNLTEAEGHRMYDDGGNSQETLPERQPQSGPPPMFPGEPPQSPQRPVTGPLGGDAVARSVEMTVRAVAGLKAAGLPLGNDAVQALYSTHFIAESKR